jgi:hypothetical protein
MSRRFNIQPMATTPAASRATNSSGDNGSRSGHGDDNGSLAAAHAALEAVED